jgi:hypothetical protein
LTSARGGWTDEAASRRSTSSLKPFSSKPAAIGFIASALSPVRRKACSSAQATKVLPISVSVPVMNQA